MTDQAQIQTPKLFPGFFGGSLSASDPEMLSAINQELGRQRHEIELIASENIVSSAVMEAQGSVLTNKYAEGYPGRRYYGGCQFVDTAEDLARERAKKLFNCSFANVQPHSGAQANQAVFFALLQPGDTYMGLNLAAGGHLTHGAPVNQSGKWFNVVQYGVREDRTSRLIMTRSSALPARHQPKMIIAGGSAYSAHHRLCPFPRDLPMRSGAYCHGRHGPLCRSRRRWRACQSAGRTPMSSPRRPTRPCAVRAAA